MNFYLKIMRSRFVLCTFCISIFLCSNIFAQKTDSTRVSYRPKTKVISRVPQIKANLPAYRLTSSVYNANLYTATTKSIKALTVFKVYPNPVNDQINISLRLDREAMLSIKITDILGNDVIALANERTAAGEHTKTYIIPDKLNTGIYFLRIVAGGEPVIKRISVL